MRISGASVVVKVFGVVTRGLTDGATSGTLVVLTIGLFTLVLFSGAIFSLSVDSAETGIPDSEREMMMFEREMEIN